MKRTGVDTYMLVREHFLSQFERLNKHIILDNHVFGDTGYDHAIKVFVFDSIEFLT